MIQDGAVMQDEASKKKKKKKKKEGEFVGFVDVQAFKTAVSPLGEYKRAPVTPQMIGLMQRYIPTAVSNKLRSGHVGNIAELREVSVLFINVIGTAPLSHTLTWVVRPMFCMLLNI